MNGGKKGMEKSQWVTHFHETVWRQKMKISKKYGEIWRCYFMTELLMAEPLVNIQVIFSSTFPCK
jgi:hypothetical protein